MKILQDVPSYSPHHPIASSVAFHPSTPTICHHSSTRPLTLDRSPARKGERALNPAEEMTKLTRTRTEKRTADDGSFSGILLAIARTGSSPTAGVVWVGVAFFRAMLL